MGAAPLPGHGRHRGCALAYSAAPRVVNWTVACVRSAWRSPLGWRSAVTALVVTWGSQWMIGRTFEAFQPVATEVLSVEMQNAPVRPATQMLQVETEAPPTGSCTRLSLNMLYRTSGGPPFIYPLGSAINGEALNPSEQSPTRRRIVLNLPVSPTIPTGDYRFVHRGFFLCSWLGGLIQRRLHYESPAFPVHVGAP